MVFSVSVKAVIGTCRRVFLVKQFPRLVIKFSVNFPILILNVRKNPRSVRFRLRSFIAELSLLLNVKFIFENARKFSPVCF